MPRTRLAPFGLKLLAWITAIAVIILSAPKQVQAGPITAIVPASNPSTASAVEALRSAPVMFVENVGQFEGPPGKGPQAQPRFQVRGANGTVWLAPEAIWITILEAPEADNLTDLSSPGSGHAEPPMPQRGVHLRISFIGARPNPQLEGFGALDTNVSYFLGNDPAGWETNVPVWEGVRYVDLYPGIDLEITSVDGQWDWQLVVRESGTSPDEARHILGNMQVLAEGASALELGRGTALRPTVDFTTEVGNYSLPLLDVQGIDVRSELPGQAAEVVGNTVVFPFASAAHPKVAAAPLSQSGSGNGDLLYSTYLGGSSSEIGYGIAVDGNGGTYVTGPTASMDFPTTTGAFDTSHNGSNDAFVVKLNASGSGLDYATFLGGSSSEIGYGIAVDGNRAAYVTGSTASMDLPTTTGAFDTSYNGGDDIFVAKLAPNGGSLLYATYLGGSNNDYGGQAIVVNESGAAHITGYTISNNFPTTPGAFDTSYNGGHDVIVAKLAPDGSSLLYSTYLGGSNGNDVGQDIVVDGNEAIYIGGHTGSSNFPTTPGAFDTSYNGHLYDLFVAKLAPGGSSLLYATYLGGSNVEYSRGLAVDGNGAAYMTGYTVSTDFPTTTGAFDTSYNGSYDAFVVKLNASGSGLDYATFLGTISNDIGNSIAVDGNGAAYMTGYTTSTDFPTTTGAFDTSFNGGGDAFVVKLNASGSDLTYATFLGSSGGDTGNSIAVDGNGAAYVTGYASSTDFPTTPGAYDTSYNGGTNDGFVTALVLSSTVQEPQVSGAGVGNPGAGCPCDNRALGTQDSTNNPINTRTGNLSQFNVDLSIPTQSGELSFSRSYSSFNARDVINGNLPRGSMSPGWYTNYDVRLVFYDPGPPVVGEQGKVQLLMADGSRIAFTGTDATGYTVDTGGGGAFTYNSGADEYTYTNTQGGGYVFYGNNIPALKGKLKQVIDSSGERLTLTYDANNNLQQVAEASGVRKLTFIYAEYVTGQYRLTRVTDNAGRYVEFGYAATGDGSFDLEWVRDLQGKYFAYEYVNSSNHPELDTIPNTMLHYIAARRGPTDTVPNPVTTSPVIMSYTYDAQGRAYRETNGANQEVVELTFGTDGATTVTYGDGVGGSETDVYNSHNTLVQEGNAAGDSAVLYDGNLRPASVVDANSSATRLNWSAEGDNLLSVVNPLNQATNFKYDSLDQVVLTTQADGTKTVFIYNTPTYWDPNANGGAGGWVDNPYDYTGVGVSQRLLLRRIEDYGTGRLNLTTLYEYTTTVPLNLVAKVTNPDNVATCFTYNAFGQQTQVFENCIDKVVGPGDQDILTSYAYDSVGRLTTVTDPLNRVTLYRYLDGDDLVDEVVTNYDGSDLNIASNYYKNGPGGVPIYNFSTRSFRDARGREIATVQNYDPATLGDNILTDAELDAALDRNLITRTYYDPAGRVQYVVQNFVGDITSSAPPTFDPSQPDRNLVSYSFYDGAGRVTASIAGYLPGDISSALGCTGAPENLDLDGDGQFDDGALELCPQHPEFNQITLTAYNTAGRVATRTTAAWPASGKGSYYTAPGANVVYNFVTAYEYDAVGNVLGTVVNFDPVQTPQAGDMAVWLGPTTGELRWIRPSITAPDRNQMSCTHYDPLNRPQYTREACLLPPILTYASYGVDWSTYEEYLADYRSATFTDYDDDLDNDSTPDGLYNVVSYHIYDVVGHQIATVENFNPAVPGSTFDPATSTIQLVVTPEYNHVTRTYYDSLGRVEYTVTNFGGQDTSGNPANVLTTPALSLVAGVDHNLITRTYYDSQGRQIAAVRNYWEPAGSADGTLTQAEIEQGLPARNLVTRSYYNSRGQVTDVVSNFVGDIASPTPPSFSAPTPDRNLRTSFTYDLLGRQETNTLVRGTGIADQRVSKVLYDELGRVQQSIQNYDTNPDPGTNPPVPYNVTTTVGYNLRSAQTTVTDPVSRVRQMTYDAMGRATQQIVDPGTGHLNLTSMSIYNAAGQPVQQTDGSGVRTDITYDAMGRTLQAVTNPGGTPSPTISITYDLLGRAQTVTHEDGTKTHYVYDNLGRVTQVFENYQGGTPACAAATNDQNVCTRFEYDHASHVTGQTLGNGSATAYAYDKLGRLVTETVDPGPSGVNIVTDYQYDAAGNQTQITRNPGGTPHVTTFAYNALGAVTNINYPGTTPDVQYTYDAFGNRQTMVDGTGTTGTWTYTYNGLNALQTVTDSNNQTVTYDYTPAGDRTSLQLNDGSQLRQTYVPDAAGRLDTVTANQFGSATNLVVDYGYNGASQITSAALPNGLSVSYGYDPAGRLQSVNNGTGSTPSSFTYTLDGRGNRTDAAEVLRMPGYTGSMNPGPSLGNQPPDVGPASQLDKVLARSAPLVQITPTETPTPTPTPTESPTPTATAPPTTETPTPDATATSDSTATATETASPTDTATPTPTETPVPTATETPTPSPTPSPTSEPPAGCLPELAAGQPFGAALGRGSEPVPALSDDVLGTEQATYQARFDEAGLHFTARQADQAASGELVLQLAVLRHDETELPLHGPDDQNGSAQAGRGWQNCDNLVFRPLSHGLFEVVALHTGDVQLGYLLLANPLPQAQQGTVAFDLAVSPPFSVRVDETGLYLLDETGNGAQVGEAVAMDAEGRTIRVELQPGENGLSLLLPADWLAQATFPVLIDPTLIPWTHTSDQQRDASLAYDATQNHALAAFVDQHGSFTDIRVRLLNAADGTQINEVVLNTNSTDGEPVVVFNPTGPTGAEYLVAYRRGTALKAWRIDADTGAPIGTEITVTTGTTNTQDLDLTIDTASGTSLLVWTDWNNKSKFRVQGIRIAEDGTLVGSVLGIQTNNSINYRNPRTTFDTELNRFVVAWSAVPATGDSEIEVRSVALSGTTMGSILAATSDTNNDTRPDVAYSSLAGRTLIVWVSAENDGDLHARGLDNGTLQTAFTLVARANADDIPELVADTIAGGPTPTFPERGGWFLAWQYTASGSNTDIWRLVIPGTASADLTASAQAVSQETAAEEDITSLVRADGGPVLMFEDAATYNAHRTLVLVVNVGDLALPAVATLVSPSGTVFTTTPTYTWNAAIGATEYTLNVQDAGGSDVITEVVQASTVCSGGTCSYTPSTALVDGQSYTWRVQARNANGEAAWSSTLNITVSLLTAPTLISPRNITGTTLPAYTWNTVANATEYRLNVKDSTDADVVNEVISASTACSGSTCTFTPSTTLTEGQTYTWRVQAQNGSYTGPWSSAFSITVQFTATYNWHYTYDGLSRVTTACAQWNASTSTCEGALFTYSYDGAGNPTRFDKWDGATVVTKRHVYNGANQIVCEDDISADGLCDDGEFLWQYDAYGNLLNDGTMTYTYDAAMRLETVATGSVITTYTYNGDGDRFTQTVGATTTSYVLDIGTPLTMVLAETTGSSTTYYLQGIDLVAQTDGFGVKYFAYDGLGSVRQVTGASGSVQMAQTFDPYGNLYSSSGADATHVGFAGEHTDSNGLVFLRARYYNPAQGRFMQMDPSRQEKNPYLYSLDNPILHTDPSGLVVDSGGGGGPDDSAQGSQSGAFYVPITLGIQGSLGDFLSGCAGAALDFLTGFLHQLLADEFMYPTHAVIEFLGMDIFGSSLYFILEGGTAQLNQEMEQRYWDGSDAYRAGRWAGRVVSTVLSLWEAWVGIGIMGSGITVIGGGIGAAAGCAGLTFAFAGATAPAGGAGGVVGIACFAGAAGTIAGGVATTLAGAAVTVHAGYVLVHNFTRAPGGEPPGRTPVTRSNYADVYRQHHPDMPSSYRVHHRIPQRYRELFGSRIVDSLENLVGVPAEMHADITNAWQGWARAHPEPSIEEVLEFERYIERIYGAYYWVD